MNGGAMQASSRDSDDSDIEDFPQPNAKRRRISNEEDTETPQIGVYAAPSRIQKPSKTLPLSSVKTSAPVTAIPTVATTDANFESLNVSPWLIHSLSTLAIYNPTEIQRSCIPEILRGRDCIGGSRTGTGKTVAFAVPILQKWAEDPFGIYAVILTPTRELALQIYEQFVALGAPQSLKVTLITGGTEMRPQAAALSRRPHIIVATPGRLADHIQTSGTETIIGLKRAKVVVLDEADRLLASGPGSMLPDLNTCLSALPPSADRLTLLFTATVTSEVRALKSAPRPKTKPSVFVSEITSDLNDTSPTASLIPSTLHQTYLQVPLTHKDAFLHVLLSVPSLTTTTTTNTKSSTSSIIIFTNRTTTADILHRTLLTLSHPVTSLHSSLPQPERSRNLSAFRAGTAKILIATDVASRGLDIPEVSTVINYDVPRNPVDYVHRVGRTARAGRKGQSITFVGQRDVELILAIEEYVGSKMVEWAEEGVNVETRVVRGRTLKDVGEARMEAFREVEADKSVGGYRRKMRKDKKRTASGS